jgi:signal transduction histidine kinase
MSSICQAKDRENGLATGEQDRAEGHPALVAVLCHDLRSLLASISATAEVLQDELASAPDDPKQEYLKILRVQSLRIADFIDKVLEVHRLEAQQVHLQQRPLPVSLLVEAAVRQFQLCTPSHDIRLALPARSPWAWGDENAFQSVLNNLLENAVKYSPAHSVVEVNVGAAEGACVVSMRDEGPGIPPAEQEKIFQCFYRSQQVDPQRAPGHGLGLYLCKLLMTGMGGTIRVDSQPGEGSCFTVSLPMMERTS